VAGFYGALALCWMLNVFPSQSKGRSRGEGEGRSPLRGVESAVLKVSAGAIVLAMYLGLGGSIKIQ